MQTDLLPPRAGGTAPHPALALVSLALAMLLASLGISSPSIALPALARAFASTFGHVQWVILAYLLASTLMMVGAGRLGDRLGHRRVLLGGLGVFTLASLLAGLAPGLWTLIAARALQGLAAAVLLTLSMALVRATVPAARTGSAMGLLGTMSAIGTALGPSLGGLLLAGPGWRAIFLLMVPLGLLAFALARHHLPGQAAPVAWQIRLHVLRHPGLRASLASNALVAAVMMATLVVGPFYLSRALGLPPAQVGIVMSVGPLISIVCGIPAGRLVDRLGATRIVGLGLLVMTAGAWALATLPAYFGLTGYLLAIALLTPGYQLFQSANNTAVMLDVAPGQRGVVAGLLGLARNLGLIAGTSLMGAVFALAAHGKDIAAAAPMAIVGGLRSTFATATALLVGACILTLAGRLARRTSVPS